MNEQTNLGASVIIFVVNNHSPEVRALLLRNGVVAPTNLTDFQLGQVVASVLKSSNNFKNEFLQFISQESIVGESLSMSGYSNASGDFSTYSIEPSPFGTTFQANPSSVVAPTTPVATAPKTGFTVDKALNVFSQGLDAFIKLDTNATNRALADASVKNTKSSGNIIGDSTYSTPTSSNSTMYIILAILGIAVVGGGIWYAVKRKKA
jgi:LPXTG-motif cell wall-anchored protein